MDKLPPLALPAVSSGRSVEIPHLYARTISRLEENQKSLPENQLKANLIEINETIEKAEWLLSHDHFEKADRELRTQLKKILYDPITYYKIVEERNFFLKTKHGGKLFLAFVKCYVLLGTACVRRKRFDDATVFFEKATAQCGTVKDKRVWSMLYTIEHETVKMLLMQGKQRESIEHLRLSQKYYALMTGDEEWLGRIKYTTDNELLKLVHGTAVTDNRINSRKKDNTWLQVPEFVYRIADAECHNDACKKHKIGGFKVCSRCLHAFYCSKQCQQDHWPTHISECGLA